MPKKKVSKSPAEVQQFKSDTGAKPTGVTDKQYGDIPPGKIVSSSPGAATRESPEISVSDRGQRQTRGAEPTVQPMFQQPVSVEEPSGYQPSAQAYNTEILPPEDMDFHDDDPDDIGSEDDAAVATEGIEQEAEEKGVSKEQLQTDTVNATNRMETDPGYADELRNKKPEDMSLGEKLAVILVSMGAGTILGEKTLGGDGTTGFLIGGAGGFGGVREQDIAEAKRAERQRDRQHDFAKMAAKQQQGTKLQRVKGRVGDEAAFANFNPVTGRYSDPETGEDLSGTFEPLVIEKPYTDPNTGKTYWADPVTGTLRDMGETRTEGGKVVQRPTIAKEFDPKTQTTTDQPITVQQGLGIPPSTTYRGPTPQSYAKHGLVVSQEEVAELERVSPGLYAELDRMKADNPKTAKRMVDHAKEYIRTYRSDKNKATKKLADMEDEAKKFEWWKKREDYKAGQKKEKKKDEGPGAKEIRDKSIQLSDRLIRYNAPYREALESADSAKKLAKMAKDNPISAGALMSKLARASGEKGVLTDNDIRRLGGSESIYERLERAGKKLTSDQKVTDADIKFALQVVNAMEKGAQISIRKNKIKVARILAVNYNMKLRDAYERITGEKAPKTAEFLEEGESLKTKSGVTIYKKNGKLYKKGK